MEVSRPARPSRQGTFVGFGDPVVDVLVRTSDAFLASFGIESGGSDLISHHELDKIRSAAANDAGNDGGGAKRMGGSAANVTRCLARLRGSSDAAHVKYVGMIGADAAGEEYEAELRSHGVMPLLQRSRSGAPTATCLCLVTPDGQRTMRTCLGAAAELASPSQLPGSWAEGAAWLHCEGYCLHRPHVAVAAMRDARRHGAQVSMDLASFEVVRHCWSSLSAVLREGLLHTVFANEEEAAAVLAMAKQEADTGAADAAESQIVAAEPQTAPAASQPSEAAGAAEPNGAANGHGATAQSPDADAALVDGRKACNSPPQPSAEQAALLAGQQVAAAQRWLLQHCQVAVVSLGERGCVARSRHSDWAACSAERVNVQDSVGAGDNFTAGWLAAHLAGAPLQVCAEAGCAAGAAAVQAVGGVPSEQAQTKLRAKFQALLKR